MMNRRGTDDDGRTMNGWTRLKVNGDAGWSRLVPLWEQPWWWWWWWLMRWAARDVKAVCAIAERVLWPRRLKGCGASWATRCVRGWVRPHFRWAPRILALGCRLQVLKGWLNLVFVSSGSSYKCLRGPKNDRVEKSAKRDIVVTCRTPRTFFWQGVAN